MANEITTKKQYTIETLMESDVAKSLAKSLNLNEKQIAKANMNLLKVLSDSKLQDASATSKIRFTYSTALLDYKSQNAIAPVVYGNGIQAQPQYQAFIEDMLECGGVKETNSVILYENVDYKPFKNKLGFTELVLPEKIAIDNLFAKPKVIGYYAYAITNDNRVCTCIMSVDEAKEWANKYSISYRAYINGKAKSAIWNDQFDTMALKTCIKSVARQVLKWYPYDRLDYLLTIDQAVFTDKGMEYKDNPNCESNTRKTNVDNVIDLPVEDIKEKPTGEQDTQEQQSESVDIPF